MIRHKNIGVQKLIRNKNMKVPCEECLCLPICKNKRHVKCSILYKWAGEHISWGEVHKYLPWWMGVTDEAYPNGSKGIL